TRSKRDWSSDVCSSDLAWVPRQEHRTAPPSSFPPPLEHCMSDRIPVSRALISVFDKTGLPELAQALHAAGVQIVSTGSTASVIAEAGVPVTAVEEVTEFPECLDGRVKTLHPRIHAGILADRRRSEEHTSE